MLFMHPPLHAAAHPHCAGPIEALKHCHATNPWRKFLGACNAKKHTLDACFRQEKELKRAVNQERARRDKARFLEIKAEYEKREQNQGR